MPLHPDFLRPLAVFTEHFANTADADFFLPELPGATMMDWVEEIFRDAIIEAARGFCVLEAYDRAHPDAVMKDRDALREWLKEISALGRHASSKTAREAQALRKRLSSPKLLGRMRFESTTEFASHGAVLRQVPTRIGVEAAMYQVIASALEHGSMVHVGRCEHGADTPDHCEKWVVSARGGSVKKPRRRCVFHSELDKRGSKGGKTR